MVLVAAVLRRGHARARAHRPARGRRGRAPPAAGPRPRRRRCCATPASGAPPGRLGITLNLSPVTPADPSSEADLEVARRVDGLQNRVFLDPLLRGGYPADVWEDLAPFGLPDVAGRGPRDHRHPDRRARRELLLHDQRARPADEPQRPSPWVGAEPRWRCRSACPRTAMGWEIEPDGAARPAAPAAPRLPRHADGHHRERRRVRRRGGRGRSVHDEDRRSYLEGHLRACTRRSARASTCAATWPGR